ncbi:MAG: hypothetical protein AAFU41_18225 [Pseudomonadota bacterium]
MTQLTKTTSLFNISQSSLNMAALWAIALGTACLTAAPATAESVSAAPPPELLSTEGAQARMMQSNNLRTLTQMVPSAACNLHAGIAPDMSQDLVNFGSDEFDRILSALKLGNPDLGITQPETRRMTLADITALENT